jgi:F-type H+-transporting ATPase subunit delta
MTNVSINNIAQAIYDSSKDKDEARQNAIIKNIIELLKLKHLIGKSDLILSSLSKIIDKDKGVIRVKLSSRSKVSKTAINEIEEFIKKRYKAKDIIITFIEDEKLLGGIKLEIGDEIIDTTLIKKIHKLQNYLITN